MLCLPKIYNLNLSTREHQTNPNQPTLYEITGQCFFKLCKRQRKTDQMSQINRDWEIMTTKCFVVLDWIVHKKRDIRVSFEGSLTYFSYFGLNQNPRNTSVIGKTIFTRQSMILLKDFWGQILAHMSLRVSIYFLHPKLLFCKYKSEICF